MDPFVCQPHRVLIGHQPREQGTQILSTPMPKSLVLVPIMSPLRGKKSLVLGCCGRVA